MDQGKTPKVCYIQEKNLTQTNSHTHKNRKMENNIPCRSNYGVFTTVTESTGLTAKLIIRDKRRPLNIGSGNNLTGRDKYYKCICTEK